MRFILTTLLLLTACERDGVFAPGPKPYTNRSFVVYKHPVTKEFKECNIDGEKPGPLQMFNTMEECKQHYESEGYKLFTEH